MIAPTGNPVDSAEGMEPAAIVRGITTRDPENPAPCDVADLKMFQVLIPPGGGGCDEENRSLSAIGELRLALRDRVVPGPSALRCPVSSDEASVPFPTRVTSNSGCAPRCSFHP